MAEEVTIKPKFTVAYIAIVLATIIALGLVAYWNFTGDLRSDFFTIFFFGIMVLSVIALLSVFLKFVATTYRVTDKEVISIEGLVTKTKRSVPFTKIDNLTVRSTVKDMVMGTASIYIDTPAGHGAEIAMHYIDSGKIGSLETMLKDLMQSKKPTEEVKEALHAEEPEAEEIPAEEKPAVKLARKPAKKKGKKK